MDDEQEPTRSELLNRLYDQVVALQDKLNQLFAEAVAAEQVDLAHQRSEEDRQTTLERLHDTSQQVIQAMAGYHVIYADWIQQFELEMFEATEGEQALRDLFDGNS